jgi:glutamate/tyrosine decarboxylase-like PLP-dependent enzyme
MNDINRYVKPYLLHWSHRHFFAYFPSGASYSSMVGDMLCSAVNQIGFSWASSPALTEMEYLMMDWWAQALGLPRFFLSKQTNSGSSGGGTLHGSASEAIFTIVMAARNRTVEWLKGHSGKHPSEYLQKLVAYTSKETHSSTEKAFKMALVQYRLLVPDKFGSLRGSTLRQAMEADARRGLYPFCVVGSVGTTGGCFFDNIKELGDVCRRYTNCWLHVDGAYAGSAFICEENRQFMDGFHNIDSFNTNANKFMLTNFDCSALWVRNVQEFIKGFIIDAAYLETNKSAIIDLRHFGIPLSRRFRALKLFMLFRLYGKSGLQRYIRNHQELARKFQVLLVTHLVFEVLNPVEMGLVCFRLRK